MANGGDLRRLADDLRGVAAAFNAQTKRAILKDVGMQSKGDVDDAVRADLGDQSMSNWQRGRPIQIGGAFDFDADSLTIKPRKGRAGGPLRVLESGRSAGRSRRGRRYGATAGKRTWSDAERRLTQQVPKRVEAAVMKQLGRVFDG